MYTSWWDPRPLKMRINGTRWDPRPVKMRISGTRWDPMGPEASENEVQWDPKGRLRGILRSDDLPKMKNAKSVFLNLHIFFGMASSAETL